MLDAFDKSSVNISLCVMPYVTGLNVCELGASDTLLVTSMSILLSKFIRYAL